MDLDRVREALRNLDGERALRNLLGRELGYEHEGGRISGDSYPEELQGDPTLLATAGRQGRFSVIHTSFNTLGKLSLMAERKVMEKLRNRYPYALHVFSDAEDQVWYFVNVPHAERAGDKQYRRIVVNAGEPSRTAIERLSMLSVDKLAEKRRVDPDELSPLVIQDLHDEAFDVEEVTKRFFQKYNQVFKNVEAGITGIVRKEDVRYFAQRLLNRLMFVAFIEKKGWLSLNGQTDYLHSLLSAYKGDRDRNGSFYASRLQLRELYGQLGSEERRERIERLEEVFRFETNMAARRELNRIHRARLIGDELIDALERLYTKYRLGELRGDANERRRHADAALVPRIVVSEAVGRG